MSRFTTVIAKFLQISLAFFRAVLQTMAPLPAKQANLEKKIVLLYFSRKLKRITSNGLSVMKPTDRKKKHLETPLINTQCSQLTRACDSRKLPVHHIITNQRGTCLPKSPIESIHLASMRQQLHNGGPRLLKVTIICSVLNFEGSTQQYQEKNYSCFKSTSKVRYNATSFGVHGIFSNWFFPKQN